MSSPQQGYRRNSFSVIPSPESQSSNALRGSIAGQQQHRQQQQNPRRSESQDRSTARRIRPVTPANWPLGNHIPVSPPQPTDAQDAPAQHAHTANELPGRTGTAFSEANTLVRSHSGRSRSSIAKYGLHEETGGSGATALRSIFPTYDHSVPLAEQHYAPVHLGPTQLPRAVISRQSVYEEPEVPSASREAALTTHGRGHDVGAAMPTSPARPAPVRGRWPLRIQTQPAPVVPTPSSTADLKNLWRVANGWKASASEGRVFCLKLTRQDDAPVYTLSSSTAQPFWKLRLDPTSASAYVNLTRHDPGKPYRQPSRREIASPRLSRHLSSGATSRRCSSSSSSTTTNTTSSDTKHWYEALTTTLQQTCRREPPLDGLVALLIPTAASKMAAQRANDAASVQAASNECARLVWDDDTSTHYLVHNALERPFCVTADRNPAYSRVEYTLEHDGSPAHIAKLTRDGTGAGWLELDTRVASQIPACYILDVVVTALLLAALADEDRHCPSATLGTFAPPPAAAAAAGEGLQRESSWPSLSGRWSTMMGVDSHSSKKTKTKTKTKTKNKENKRRNRTEEFELDLESQTESLGKEKDREKDKLPLLARVVVKLTKGFFALVLCVLTVLFKCVGGVLKALYACLGSKY
ncbi:hypothetical protein E4U43_005815 [Claviceps pusilla]|uniref:Acetylserotonin methytransferase-like protein n=1 Tax=Claviceps pusilla TaxID=123648 RepID=A0A9P7N428_9HYPO|nr:hypothetical protein E4U43_005815 [Claviceps pusilla]